MTLLLVRGGNTLINPKLKDDKPFDAIVSNPPYSVKWIGSDDPTLINDDRFAPAGVLAPKSKADFAFVLHALSYLSGKGRAALVCFPGIFYLMTDAHIEAIMQLFDTKDEVAHIATTIDNAKIAENDYNLSVSSYVEPKDTREKIDIVKLNAEVAATVKKIDRLRAEIDTIVKEIEA